MGRPTSLIVDTARATAFLDLPHLAVVGVSDDPKNFGRAVLNALQDAGRDAVAVRDLRMYEGPIDGVIEMVNKAHAADVVRDALDRGVRHVWLFKGIGGGGSVSDEAVAACADAGAEVRAGA